MHKVTIMLREIWWSHFLNWWTNSISGSDLSNDTTVVPICHQSNTCQLQHQAMICARLTFTSMLILTMRVAPRPEICHT